MKKIEVMITAIVYVPDDVHDRLSRGDDVEIVKFAEQLKKQLKAEKLELDGVTDAR